MKQAYILFKKTEKKVVFLVWERPIDNGVQISFVGSGFILEKKFIITNHHVLESVKKHGEGNLFAGIYDTRDSSTGVTTYARQKIDYTEVVEDIENDLSILKLPSPVDASKSFTLDSLISYGFSSDFKQADEAIYCGFPLATEFVQIGLGLTLFTNKCSVAALKYNISKKNLDFILIDSHVNPSSSGSPLISLSSEKILGIISGTFHQNYIHSTAADIGLSNQIQIPRNIGLVRPANYIYDLVNKALGYNSSPMISNTPSK